MSTITIGRKVAPEAKTPPRLTVLIPPVHTLQVDGKFIKIKTRTFGEWTFYTGLIVVDKFTLGKLEAWVETQFGNPDYLPYFSNEKEFMGNVQTSHFIQFDIKGESVNNEDAWKYINDLETMKAFVTVKLQAAVSVFKHKDGKDKKKLSFQLQFNGIAVADPTAPPAALETRHTKKRKAIEPSTSST